MPFKSPLLARALALVLVFAATALGQEVQPPLPADPQADAAADTIIRQWTAGKFTPPKDDTDPLNLARRMLLYSPPPKNARVSFHLRKLVDANGNRRSYLYPITSDQAGDENVNLTIAKQGGTWQVASLQRGTSGPGLPAFITGPQGQWLFIAITALLAYLTLAPTIWRRWMIDAWLAFRRHWRVYVWTNIVLYGCFVLGMLLGGALPGVVQLIQEAVTSSLQQTGVTDALSSGGVANAAFGIAYWNFTMGAFLTTFIPGALLGVLAYLYNVSRLLVLGLAFAPGSLPIVPLLLHIPTIIVELQAYIIVTAGAGVLLVRVVRGGMVAFAAAWRDYAKSLTWALVILVIAAWYEAFEILRLIPLVTGR